MAALQREAEKIDMTVKALMTGLDPANLPMINDQFTQLRRRKEHLQAELRAARAASRGTDDRALRKWAAERITGLADAVAGRRNERVRRVIASYIDEIVVYPTERRGVMRLNAGLAALVGDAPLAPNASDRPVGRSRVAGIEGSKPSSNKSLETKRRHVSRLTRPLELKPLG